ncbi:MAG: hypothetical protein R2698_10660 [Microthrixaceae bacterium]
MDLLTTHAPQCRVHVTTNGTQWTPRVERIIDRLPVDVAVSLDAATADTYEAIRIGSSWANVQTNLDRFLDAADRRGTTVTVTMCLMRNNWHEFFEFCREADRRGIGCDVNTVTQPAHLSLYRMTSAEIATVVAEMEATERRYGSTLGRSRRTWSAELDKLRSHLAALQAETPVSGLDVRRSNPEFPEPYPTVDSPATEPVAEPSAIAPPTIDPATDPHGDEDAPGSAPPDDSTPAPPTAPEPVLPPPTADDLAALDAATTIHLDGGSVVAAITGATPGAQFLGREPSSLLGSSLATLQEFLRVEYGDPAEVRGGVTADGARVYVARCTDGTVMVAETRDDNGTLTVRVAFRRAAEVGVDPDGTAPPNSDTTPRG